MEGIMIKKINKEADEILARIHEFEAQIKEYKNGAESFADATDAIKNIEGSQAKIISEISNYVKKLDSLDTAKISDAMTTLSGEMGKISKKIDSLQSDVKDMGAKIEKLDEKINKTKSSINSMDGKIKKIDSLQSDVKDMGAKIEKLDEKINKTKSSITSMDGKIDHVFKRKLRNF